MFSVSGNRFIYRKQLMIRYLSILFILFLSFSSISFPGGNKSSSREAISKNHVNTTVLQLITYDIDKSLNDGWDIIRAPANFNGKDWAITGIITGGTALSMLLDDEIRSVVRRNQTSTMNNITNIGQYYGEVVPAVSLSAGIYIAGLAFNERSLSLTGRLLAESLLYAGTINVLLKVILSRSRPYNNQGNSDFGNYNFNNDNYSMPSGHTTVAFTVSTVLSERIDNIYATIGLYGLACLTAYQRIYSDNHWFSDTVLGAAIGTVIGRAVVKLNESDPYEYDEPNILLLPIRNGLSLSINFRF